MAQLLLFPVLLLTLACSSTPAHDAAGPPPAPTPTATPAPIDAAVPPGLRTAAVDAAAGNACGVAVTEVLFLPRADGRVDVNIFGTGLIERAIPPEARIGQQPLRAMLITQGGGAAGMIDRMPARGDHLFIGYVDEELCDVGLVY
jgi:hypothetical protein